MEVFLAVIIPFVGTAAGAGCVFFLKNQLSPGVHKALLGLASGVMVAASVWSLLIPAMDMSEHMGKLAFVPAAVGFLLGMGFLLLMDAVVPHMHGMEGQCEGPACSLQKSTMLMFAVTLHNFPEGMAVGVVLAGGLEAGGVSMASALALAIGIAIQNFPEGAILSLPLKSNGFTRRKAFAYGALSGIVEPLGAVLTLALAQFIRPVLPYLLAFAAGAMVYVVVEELIPESAEGEHSNIGTIGFALGFAIMMILDVALG